jgi:hypothetical protein
MQDDEILDQHDFDGNHVERANDVRIRASRGADALGA